MVEELIKHGETGLTEIDQDLVLTISAHHVMHLILSRITGV